MRWSLSTAVNCGNRRTGRRLARTASRATRAVRRGARQADEFAVPAIPDYVDGSFRTAGDEAAGRVPAARHAA